MTNNIEKLYELAEVKRITPPCWFCPYKIGCVRTSDECPQLYPPFTSEKQLELIKWFLHNTYRNYILFSYRKFEDTGIKAIQYKASSEHIDYFNQDFDQALSGLVIELWNDLTDKQKEEIKEILK